ncbi:MAG: hypothetical protein IPJ77_23010 [Planctomycetes bacterium]|nr:hypothetical protein [Planctomycetota bacterium]
MEHPIAPVPDRLVPQPKAHAERRGRRAARPRERAHALHDDARTEASVEPAAAPHKQHHAHEDGVGERIDVTA